MIVTKMGEGDHFLDLNLYFSLKYAKVVLFSKSIVFPFLKTIVLKTIVFFKTIVSFSGFFIVNGTKKAETSHS